jgi:translocator protein
MEKSGTRSLLFFLIVCYAVAFISGIITRPEITTWYGTLNKPTWRPPNWLFGPVWTILYGIMAVAGWKVWCAATSRWRTAALWIFAGQLMLNFCWSPIFFSLHQIGIGFLVVACLEVSLLLFILATRKFERAAAWLFVPYLAWVSFAALLNYSIWRMNPI